MYACIHCYGRLERYWNGLMSNEQKVEWSGWMGDTPLNCYDYQSTCGANKYETLKHKS